MQEAGRDASTHCDVQARFEKHHASLDLLSVGVEATDPKDFLIRFAAASQPIIGAEAILVWLANKTTGRYELIAPISADRGTASTPRGHWLDQETVRALSRELGTTPTYMPPWPTSSASRLVGALEAFGQIAGAIEVQFPDSPCQTCEGWAKLTADFVRHASEGLENVRRSQMVRSLSDALSGVAEAETIDDLEKQLLEGAFKTTGCETGAVLLLNNDTGGLDMARCKPAVETDAQLSMDAGVTGQSLRSLKPIRLGDVKTHKHFQEYWPDIRSELAIPLYVPNSSVRVPNEKGTHIDTAPKRIGVLNLESPLGEAFSEFDEQCLMRLALTASLVYDRLQIGDVFKRLHAAESELAQNLASGQDWLDVITAVGDRIKDTLAFSHINISIVSLDGKRIKSEYIWWDRSDEDSKLFKELSDHDIEGSDDIQAHVVRTRQIEVPRADDRRFHPVIHHKFGLDALIRVYLPMTMGDVVVGTLETGYRRRFRQFIYERDIQILKALGDYAAAAIWKRRRGQLDVLRHEIAAPRKAVMDNAIFLQRNWATLGPEKIGWKLEDIFLDGEVIDSLLDKIEYYVTGHIKPTKSEYCNVGSAVIMKTIFQQNRLLRSLNLDLARIKYVRDDLTRVRTVVDRVKASEVFNNLFGNAIKYRRSDESLSIEVTVESAPDRYLIRISDKGIGIDAGSEMRIFEEGYRSPTAIQRAQGSGLGLWLARQYMRDMGGDIILENARDPTKFRVDMLKKDKP
jgi:signal transduction histidine kinase